MSDARRTRIAGRGVPLRGDDIDTDRIIPARFLRCVVFDGLGEHAFADDRAQERARGAVHPFDDPRFAGARILLVGRNFGCGSSREHAPQALHRRGIDALVGESFAEIFAGNCLALGIPCVTAPHADVRRLMEHVERHPDAEVRVDLVARCVTTDGLFVPVTMPDGARAQLIEGRWDSMGELLDAREAIAGVAARLPYLRGWA